MVGKTEKAHNAFRRAINHTGSKGRTQVVRALTKQTGAKRATVLAALHVTKANFGSLEYKITARGQPLSLKEFGAKQFGYGVKAKPWGNSRRFEGAFIFAGTRKSGKFVAGGHVFKRTGGFSANSGRNNAIEKMFGPSIPKELVKDASAAAFERTADDLGQRVQHELSRMTRGVVS
ncbi:hypothetical protein [Palleronia sp.]|uniref:hypothetical protein n=1 Tax=Palleronia sp. TaxID=1940284 RepID=UPI0035C85CAA